MFSNITPKTSTHSSIYDHINNCTYSVWAKHKNDHYDNPIVKLYSRFCVFRGAIL